MLIRNLAKEFRQDERSYLCSLQPVAKQPYSVRKCKNCERNPIRADEIFSQVRDFFTKVVLHLKLCRRCTGRIDSRCTISRSVELVTKYTVLNWMSYSAFRCSSRLRSYAGQPIGTDVGISFTFEILGRCSPQVCEDRPLVVAPCPYMTFSF